MLCGIRPGSSGSIDNFEKIIWKVKLFDHGIYFLLEFDISVDMEGEFWNFGKEEIVCYIDLIDVKCE